ncbi:hypothetical protein [Cryptosporangium arvum]|uniref:hypothetical protein n=1 Tax=Cryptosporangium arvum TaxID=80871 RepID=UPI0004B7C2DA|nr:hypothetical protein [Cryptosporangium arvum]
MPTTRSRGLSTADLDSLRTAVEAGRKPKVQFTSAAGQIAGQIGQVVRLDDPSADEWVVVRFGRDELPFAPTDLQIAPKAPPRQKAVPKAAIAPAGVESVATAPSAPPAAVAAATSTATRPVTAAATPAEAAASAKPATTAKPAAPVTATKPAAPAAAARVVEAPKPAPTAPRPVSPTVDDGAAKPAAKARPARKAGAKRAPDLTVTLAHHEGHWTVSAARGARVLVKPTSVRAADALKMVGLLESPAVADAVDEIVSAARAEAEEQAERLRQQLAEVEAALADLSDPEE